MADQDPKPPSAKYLSKTPSWISLGFVLGALFVWALPAPKPAQTEPASAPPVAPPAKVSTARPTLTEIEAVFAIYGRFAVWDHDVTEVALWDTETEQFSRCYEITRANGQYYFRSIDRLTRPVLTHGVKGDGPLVFTETAEQRQEWLQEKANERTKMLNEPLLPPISPPPRITTPGDGI